MKTPSLSQKMDTRTCTWNHTLSSKWLEFFEGGLISYDEQGHILFENDFIKNVFSSHPSIEARVKKELFFVLQDKKERLWEEVGFVGKFCFQDDKMYLFLKKKTDISEEFCSFVVHEMKNPLTVIKSYAELLQDETKEEIRNKASKIEKASRKIENMLKKLKALVFLEKKETKTFFLQEALQRSVEELSLVYPNRKIEIRGKKDFQVEGDPDLLFHVVANIVENGIKYSSEATPIIIAYEEKKDGWELGIQDQGCGIQEKHLHAIFQKFYQIDPSREGKGLGLFLVRKIMELWGGKITLTSQEKTGTSFSLFFPKKPI